MVSQGGRKPSTEDPVETRIKIVQRGDRGMPDGGRRELLRDGGALPPPDVGGAPTAAWAYKTFQRIVGHVNAAHAPRLCPAFDLLRSRRMRLAEPGSQVARADSKSNAFENAGLPPASRMASRPSPVCPI